MQILTSNHDTFEYKIDNDTYLFQKESEMSEDEQTEDQFTEYQLILILNSGANFRRTFVKRYRDNKQERDKLFDSFKSNPRAITDFNDWEPY